MNDHIAAADLAAYVDGALKGEQKQGLEAHLSRCRECLEALADIVDIQNSRVKIPAEFVSRALKVLDEGTLKVLDEGTLKVLDEGTGGEKTGLGRKALPMRLVFGVAAVFLVVVVVGYFYLGDRSPVPGTVKRKEQAERIANPPASPGPAIEKKAVAAVQARDTMSARREPAAKGAAVAPRVQAMPDKKLADFAAPMNAEPAPAAEEKRESRIVGGLQETAREKDKASDMNMAAAKAAAPFPARSKEFPVDSEPSSGARPAAIASAGAVQLLLAVSGRAASPLGIDIADLAPRPFIRFAGDVSRADLSDPGILDGWSWFQNGMVLELAIDASGVVTAVTPVGAWSERAVTQAREAAAKLRFSASGKKSRRAVLTAAAGPPSSR